MAATLLIGFPAAIVVSGTEAFAPLLAALAATLLLAVVGAVDDLCSLPIMPRLLLQSAAVAMAIAAVPAQTAAIAVLPWWIDRAIVVLACLWFVNLTNFMDGIDWMTVVEVAPVSAGLAFLGMLGVLSADVTMLALALLGGIVGFAPFNKPKAQLFLGDVGSLPIGLMLGWMLVQLAGNGHLAAALLLPLYYLADATITLVGRMVRGEKFWSAHRQHFYQRALDGGQTITSILARILAVNVVLIAFAAASVWANSTAVSLALLGGGGMLVAALLFTLARKTA